MQKIFSLLFVLSFVLVGHSQGTISELLLEKVNTLRDSLGLNKLKLDKTLLEAGNDHAYYMTQGNKLGHFQGTYTKETPSERVLYYGGNRTYVGENVAKVPYKETIQKTIDVKAIANLLFKSWFNSPGHYKNLIHPDYKLMGLGFWLSNDKQVFAAQVFSSNEIKLPRGFRNKDFAWGIRPSEKTCKDQPTTYETMYFANSVSVEGNSVYLYFHDMDFFKHVIANDNDGLAIDIVLREQLPCSKENQFHISLVHDGEMQKPIYKHDIFRYNISENPKKIKVKIGEVPSYLRSEQWDANIIIINDNKLCDYSVPVNVPSDIFPLLEIAPYYTLDDAEITIENNFKIHIEDSIHVELFYERSKKRFFSFSNYEFHRLLSWGDFVKSVDIDCFASVEGAKWFNELLLEERESSVLDLLLKSDFDIELVNLRTSENWELMQDQIRDHQLDYLEGKSEPQIKYYLKKHQSKLIDSLLFDQRKTHIHAVVDTTLMVQSYEAYQFVSGYDSTISIQDLPWNKILREDHILKDYPIDALLIEELMDTPRLRTNLLGASSIDIGRNYLDSVIIEKFIKEVDATDSKELFNYAHFLTNYWYSKFARWYGMKNVAQSITPNDLKVLMSNIDTTIIDVVNLSRLRVNILLSGIHYYVAHNNWQPVESYFDEIVELVKLNNFNPQEALDLALFCNHFHKFEQAIEIMHPFHEEERLSENGYFVLAKTSTLIRLKLDTSTYRKYMASAKKANHTRYCNWLDTEFQIQRDEFIKHDFCNECTSKFH